MKANRIKPTPAAAAATTTTTSDSTKLENRAEQGKNVKLFLFVKYDIYR